jgi:Ca2+-binding RTX toxin-like protein
MRITHRLAALSAAAAIATLAAARAAASTAGAATAPKCDKTGVCFTLTRPPLSSTTTVTVTGTAGNDNIVLSNLAAIGSQGNVSSIGVNGLDTRVSSTHDAVLVVKGLAGNDQISMPTLSGTNGFVFYGSATLDGGDGNDTITGANRADTLIGGKGRDVLDGAAGNDQLNAADGEADTVRGGAGTDNAQADALDKLDGVEATG